MRKDRAYQGFETAWTTAKMILKMLITLFVIVLIVHVLIVLGWTLSSDGADILAFINETFRSMGLLSWSNPGQMSEFYRVLKMRVIARFVDTTPVWFLYFILLGIFRRRGREQGKLRHIRGARLVSSKALVKQITKVRANRGSRITLGTIPIPRKEEVKHWFLVGRPGVGKTVAISSVIEQLIATGGKGIIYDFKGDYTERFFRPGLDIIFNPLDARGLKWKLLSEAKTPMDIDGISASLIPEGIGDNTFWHAGARDIFSGILHCCLERNKTTNRDIWDMLSLSIDDLVDALKNTKRGTRAYALLQNKDKIATGMIANMMLYAGVLEYMADTGDSNIFSISEWMNKEAPGFIFVNNYSKIKDTLKPILSLFIDMLSRELLAMEDDYDRRVFYILDEFGTLQELNSIKQLLTLSRSRGGSVWLGIQDIGQIEKIYGQEGRQTIVNSCGGNLIFSVADPDTSEYLARKIGDHEYYEVEANHSMGPGEHRDGVSLAERKHVECLLLPSQIQSLRDLICYFKVLGFDLAQIELPYKKYSALNEPFIMRKGLELEVIAENHLQKKMALEDLIRQRNMLLKWRGDGNDL